MFPLLQKKKGGLNNFRLASPLLFFRASASEAAASSLGGAGAQKRDPRFTPLPREIYGSKRVFSMYASAFEEIPLTRLERLTSDPGGTVAGGFGRGAACVQTTKLDLWTRPQCESVDFMSGSVQYGIICLFDSHVLCWGQTTLGVGC